MSRHARLGNGCFAQGPFEQTAFPTKGRHSAHPEIACLSDEPLHDLRGPGSHSAAILGALRPGATSRLIRFKRVFALANGSPHRLCTAREKSRKTALTLPRFRPWIRSKYEAQVRSARWKTAFPRGRGRSFQ